VLALIGGFGGFGQLGVGWTVGLAEAWWRIHHAAANKNGARGYGEPERFDIAFDVACFADGDLATGVDVAGEVAGDSNVGALNVGRDVAVYANGYIARGFDCAIERAIDGDIGITVQGASDIYPGADNGFGSGYS